MAFKICVFGADFLTGNMGVSALAAGTVRCIQHSFPGAEIVFLGYARSASTFHVRGTGQECVARFVNMRFSKKFYQRNNIARLLATAITLKLIPSKRLRNRVVSANACLREIHEADWVVSVAGGDSFSDIYGLFRFFYACLPQLLVLISGRRLLLLPQTLGPFKARLVQVIARYIMRGAERVYSRDHVGLQNALKLLGRKVRPGKLRFCYDMAFVVEPTRPKCFEIAGLKKPALRDTGHSELVGLNVSGLLSMGGYTRRNMFGLAVEYDQLIRSLVDLLIEKKNACVLFIPHVFGSGGESDVSACERIYQELEGKYGERLGLVRGTYDYGEIKYVIGQCDFFVGARMHACIAAISQCIPAVSIAYSDKFIGVMEAVGVEELVADARRMDLDGIREIVERAYDKRAVLREKLELKMPVVKDAVLNLFAQELDAIQKDRDSSEAKSSTRNQALVSPEDSMACRYGL